MINGVATAAEARIKALQPYHRGTAFPDDPLWILQEMNNTDKHRLLVLSSAFVAGGGDIEVMSGTLHVDHGALMKVMIQTPVENDAELMRVQAPKSDVKVRGTMSAAVMVKKTSNAKPEPAVPLLTQLCDFTRGVIDIFKPHFN